VALKSAIKGMQGIESRVGWFPSAKYEDGTPVAGVMMVQEFGSGKRGIPARPTMRPTAAEKQKAWAQVGAGAGRAVMAGTMPPDGVVRALAMTAQADVRRAIIDLKSPPLSILTLLARKHRKDTGRKVAGGKELGGIDKAGRANGPPDVSGVSTKPLNDTGYALATLAFEVGKAK
jgi:hypothetical protein